MCVWKFEWVTDWKTIWGEDFLVIWQTHLEQAQDTHVFSTPALVRAWWLASREIFKIEPRFMLATFENAKIFMPLVLVKQGIKNGYLRILHPAGSAEFDYHDPISCCVPDSGWYAFWQAFTHEVNTRWRGEFDLVNITGLRNNSGIANAVRFDSSPYLSISEFESAEQFLASLNGSLRGDIRRQLRRLEKFGAFSFNVINSDETAVALGWLPEILRQHSQRWPDSYKMPGFHEHIVRQAQAAGILHISELKFGDTVVSRHLGFYYCNRFYWYMPVYDPVYQNYSPGKIHLYLCILDAITRNGEIFDFLRGVEEYKLQWTEQVSQLYELSLCGRTAGSVIRLAFAESVKPVLQELRIKLYSVKL